MLSDCVIGIPAMTMIGDKHVDNVAAANVDDYDNVECLFIHIQVVTNFYRW